MEHLAAVLSALTLIAWPVIVGVAALMFFKPVKGLIDSARGRRFTIKVGGNELTMEEASTIQSKVLADLQAKLAELERCLGSELQLSAGLEQRQSGERIRIRDT